MASTIAPRRDPGARARVGAYRREAAARVMQDKRAGLRGRGSRQ